MTRIAGHFIRILTWVAVGLLVCAAVLVALARQLVSGIHEMQPQVAGYLSERTGWHISFDNLQGSWKGLAPRFQLQNVLVRQQPDQPPAILLRGLDLEVLLLPTLLHLEPRVRITLEGALLTLAKQDGGMRIVGLDSRPRPQEAGMGFNRMVDLIAAQPRAEISDSRVVVLDWYDMPVVLHLQRLKVESAQGQRYLAGDVTLQGPSQLGFQLRGRVNGSLLRPDQLDGELYLDTAHANWLPWIPPHQRHFQQVELTGLLAGAETWLSLRDGVVQDASVRFVVHEFNLDSDNEVQPPQVKRMSGLARWQRGKHGGWQAGIQEFRMVTPDFNWQPSILSLAATPQPGGGMGYGLSLDEADITPWLQYFLSTQANSGRLYSALYALRPEGKLRHLSLFMLHKDDRLQDIRLAARLEQLNSHAWEKYPGFQDLDLDIWAHNDIYVVRLDDEHLELDYPWLFREPLTLKHAAGTVALTRQEDGLLLQSGLIQLHNEEVRTATQFSLHFPFDRAQPPFMQLQATLRDIDAGVTSRYLPAGIMTPRLLQWLDDSVLAGKLVRGDVVVHGKLGPAHVDERRVLLGFSVHDGELRFLPDWEEPVRHGDADVIVDRGRVLAQVTRGEYFGQTLVQGSVEVPRVPVELQSLLRIHVETRGPAEQGFAVLQTTPLAEMAAVTRDMAVSGEMQVNLALTVPLEPGEQTLAAEVEVALEQGRFRLESRDLQVDEVSAQVHFSLQHGLSSPRLQGKALGGPVRGTLQTVPYGRGGQITTLQLTGSAAIPALQDWLKLSLLAPLSGTVPYELQMDLPMGAAREQRHGAITVQSNLQGTAIALPFPFGKSAQGREYFRVWLSLDRDPALLEVRYGDLFELVTQSREGQLQKGALTLGGERALLPSQDRFVVQGELPRLVVGEWLPVLDSLQSASTRYGEGVQTGHLQRLGQSRLTIQEFVLGSLELGRQHLGIQPQGDHWLLTLSGDFLQGSAVVPAYVLDTPGAYAGQQTPVVINLAQVQLPAAREEDTEGPAEPWQPVNLSPRLLPAADISIERLLLGEGDFGRWSLTLRPQTDGMALQNVSASFRGVELAGSGNWRDLEGARSTQLSGKYSARDVAEVMRSWGGVATLGSEVMTGSLALQWPGAPFEFSLARAQGNVDLTLKEGSFYNVQSGVVGKFWGALNFETLLRRLQLNFKDLQQEDMVYDEIRARGRLDAGMLHLANLELESPAIRLQTDGRIDLNASQLDLEMNVTVPVTRNLVLPAAVVGGMPAAAVVWAVEKVFGSQFDKLTTIKYDVKGGFDAPKVTVKESFNIIPDKVSETVIPTDRKNGQ